MGEEEPRPDAKRRRKKEEGLSGQGLQGRKGTGKEGLRANDQLGKSNWELLKARGGLSKPKGGREKKVGKEKGTSSSGSGKDNGKKKREVQRGQPDIARGNLTRLLAIDCEMVGAGVGGSVSLLARVSIVNANGQVVYDRQVLDPSHALSPRSGFRSLVSFARTLVLPQLCVARQMRDRLPHAVLWHPAAPHQERAEEARRGGQSP